MATAAACKGILRGEEFKRPGCPHELYSYKSCGGVCEEGRDMCKKCITAYDTFMEKGTIETKKGSFQGMPGMLLRNSWVKGGLKNAQQTNACKSHSFHPVEIKPYIRSAPKITVKAATLAHRAKHLAPAVNRSTSNSSSGKSNSGKSNSGTSNSGKSSSGKSNSGKSSSGKSSSSSSESNERSSSSALLHVEHALTPALSTYESNSSSSNNSPNAPSQSAAFVPIRSLKAAKAIATRKKAPSPPASSSSNNTMRRAVVPIRPLKAATSTRKKAPSPPVHSSSNSSSNRSRSIKNPKTIYIPASKSAKPPRV